MDPIRWGKIRTAFDELVGLDAAGRARRLAALEATDPAMRQALERLLAADADLDEARLALAPPLDPLRMVGRTVSHFRVIEPLSAGGMGVVYRAEDTRLRRPVALKFLLPQYLPHGATRERFLREARAAAALDHPNLCAIYEVGEGEDGWPFLAMPLYPGETLQARLAREGRLAVEDAVTVATQIARGLVCAHAAGIVHRDLKPGNLMLLPDGVVKILDFGLAKGCDLSLTGSGERLGTVAYMAPEQVRGEAVDGRADLWSLGVVLYEMLAGRRPFPGEEELSVAHAILHQEPVPLSLTGSGIAPALGGIVERLLRKDPSRRPPTAEALLAALSTVHTHRGPARAAADGGPLRRWGRALLASAAALALGSVLAFAATGGFAGGLPRLLIPGSDPAASLVAAGVLDERERILLADFESRGGDPHLADAVTDAFRVDLAQSRTVSVVDPATVREVLRRMDRPPGAELDLALALEVAARQGIKAVVAGEITPAGDGYVLTARLVSAETGEDLAAHRETARDSSAVIPAIDRLSERLRERIGEPLKGIRASPPLSLATTSSLDALRKHAQAIRAIEVDGDILRGLALLEESVELDPGFASALRKIGVIYLNQGQRSRAREVLRRAFENRHRLPDGERHRLEGTYFIATGEREKAIAAFRTVLEIHPEATGAMNNLGILYAEIRNDSASLEVFRRMAAEPSSRPQSLNNAIEALISAGHLDEAERVVAGYRWLAADHPYMLYWRSWIQYHRGDRAGERATLRRLEETQRGTPWWEFRVTSVLAAHAATEGRLAEAERWYEARATAASRQQTPHQALESLLHLAALDALIRRDPERAVRRIEAVLARYPLDSMPTEDRPYAHLAWAYALAGRPDRARAALRELEGNWGTAILAQRVLRAEVEAILALEAGDPREALRRLAYYEREGCRDCTLPHRARAFEALGQPDSAIAAYERFVSSTVWDRWTSDQLWLVSSHERLGALYAARGDRERAAGHYRRVLDLWRDADPELRPRVAAVGRRLSALR